MSFASVERAAMVAHDGRRLLVVQAAQDRLDQAALCAAVAWAQVDEVRLIETMPVDTRHNAKIDYPALRRWLESPRR